MRKVRGLEFAERCSEPPANRKGGTKDFAPSAADGLRYQKHLSLYLAGMGNPILYEQWFKFRDQKGTNFCQTDIIVAQGKRIVVVEAKLTQKAEGELKLEKLYLPVVSHVFPGCKVFAVLAFQNILVPAKRMLGEFREIFSLPEREAGKVYHLHWSGF